MEPPPLPAAGRFRIRVQVYAPQDIYNSNATPFKQFMIAKTPTLPLPDLTLQQLCTQVVERFQLLYPGAELFAIDRSQDSYGSDLYLGDRVRDVFGDNEVFRVIKGSSFRASVDPHRERSVSVRPQAFIREGSLLSGKRRHSYPNGEDLSQAEKRQKVSQLDPDRPVRSLERDEMVQEVQSSSPNVRLTKDLLETQESMGRRSQGPHQSERVQARSSLPILEVPEGYVHRSPSKIQLPSNSINEAIVQENRIISPRSFSSSKESDVQKLHTVSGTKRKLLFVDDQSDIDRRRSSPTSAGDHPATRLVVADNNKKLKRPSAGVDSHRTGAERSFKNLSSVDIYDDIETDDEQPRITPATQRTVSKATKASRSIGVSAPIWNALSNPLENDASSLHSRINTQGSVEQQRRRSEQEQEQASRPAIYRTEENSRQAASALRVQETREREEVKVAKARFENVDEEKRRAAEEERKSKEKADTELKVESERKRLSEVAAVAKKNAEEDLAQKLDRQAKNQKLYKLQATSIDQSRRPTSDAVSKGVGANKNGSLQLANGEPPPILPGAIARRATPSSSRNTSTPFIPSGRPQAPRPSSQFSSAAVTTPSRKDLSPNVDNEASLSQNKSRQVSFADQTSSIPRGSSSASSFKQTTLVPPRLGITDVKSTTKKNAPRALSMSSELSRSNKGKAKAVECLTKQISPAIVISSGEVSEDSDEEVDKEHTPSKYDESSFAAPGEAGPSYKSLAGHLSHSHPPRLSKEATSAQNDPGKSQVAQPRDRTPQSSQIIINSDIPAKEENSFWSPFVTVVSNPDTRSPPKAPRLPMSSNNPLKVFNKAILPPSKPSKSRVSQETSSATAQRKIKASYLYSQTTFTGDVPKASSGDSGIKPVVSEHRSGKDVAGGDTLNGEEQNPSDDESRPIITQLKAPENITMSQEERVEGSEGDLNQDGKSEEGKEIIESEPLFRAGILSATDGNAQKKVLSKDYESEEADSSETGDSDEDEDMEDAPIATDKESSEDNEESDGESAVDETVDINMNPETAKKVNPIKQIEPTEEDERAESSEYDEKSDEEGANISYSTQSELDSQLLSQIRRDISSPLDRFTAAPEIVRRGSSQSSSQASQQLSKSKAQMPSLRRLNEEAQRNKREDAAAAKARGLAKAQKEQEEAEKLDQTEETEEDSSESSSSESSGAEDEDDKRSDRNTATNVSSRQLNQEDSVLIRSDLPNMIGDLFPPSPEQLSQRSKSSQIRKTPNVGFAKLGRQFSVKSKSKPR